MNREAIQFIEGILNKADDYEIPLKTSDIQYGQFDISRTHHLILLHEDNHLKLYDHVNELDQLAWDRTRWGPVNDIHWCDLKECFFILTWSRLYALTIMKSKTDHRSNFHIGNLTTVDQVKSTDFRQRPWRRETSNRLRFITVNSNGLLFLNRGYHTIEQWSIQTWVTPRRWRNETLDLSKRDQIKLITCSRNGDHLAMNVCLDDQSWMIDFRRIDSHLTLIKRLQPPQGSIWSHKLDISTQETSPISEWLIIDDRNSCYVTQLTNSSNQPDKEDRPRSIRTEGLPPKLSTGYPLLYFRWFYCTSFLVVSAPCEGEQGKLSFFLVPRSE